MKALVLSGGKGTRLRPLTYTIAKQLIPVANKPILHFCLENIIEAGITDIGIIISPDTGDLIQESLLQHWIAEHNINLQFIIQEEPMGLAHAVKVGQSFLGEDDFVMYLGDNLIKYNLKDLIDEFKNSKARASILLKEVENPQFFGVAVVDNNKKQIIDLEEKPKNPKSNLALVGVYLFSKEVHNAIAQITPSQRGELEITDAIYQLIKGGHKVNYKVLSDWWLDTGKKDDLLAANRIILDHYITTNIKGTVSKDSKIVGRVRIGKNTVVENSIIRGPSIIGDNCVIKNAFIGSFTSISDFVTIENSEIQHSVVLHDSKIADIHNLIDESLVGSNVIIQNSDTFPRSHKFLVGDDSVIYLK